MQRIVHIHFRQLFTVKMFPNISATRSTGDLRKDARKIFQAACESVLPSSLVHKAVEVHSNSIVVQGKSFPTDKNVYIVGFGKAVLGMAEVLEYKLKDHLVSGMISVPEGIGSTPMGITFNSEGFAPIPKPTPLPHISKKSNSRIQIFEGAMNNIPDYNSSVASANIIEFVASLKESDILLVLISGGGSALLPAPIPPLLLEEKKKVISLLAGKGANIEELNTVRKRLSLLKGGKLALMSKPATVITLILSDIIGDKLSMIASGPTVLNTDDPNLALSIIEKYNLRYELPKSAIQLLREPPIELVESKSDFTHVNNFIIGNNQTSLNKAAETAVLYDYLPIIMTRELKGIAKCVGKKLITIVTAALQQDIELFSQICDELHLQLDSKHRLLDSIKDLQSNGQKLCLLFGGETTVEVCGSGIGGRNQELALGAAIELHAKKSKHNILLLSAGTDGIDGPTPAAGAIATASTVDVAEREKLDPVEFLDNNDSYTFYSKVNNGEWLLRTGHTGTNVMDIIIILIS